MNSDVVELWGCGFNQFNQIDETGEDISKPKRIATVASPDIDSIEVLWAGWADLLCTFPNPPLLICRSNSGRIQTKIGFKWIWGLYIYRETLLDL